MLEFGDNVIQQPNQERYFDVDFVFDSRFDFQVAFALTTYDKDDAPWDDTYGRVVARQKIWGEIDEDGKKKLTYFKELEVGPCERELFILGDEDDN